VQERGAVHQLDRDTELTRFIVQALAETRGQNHAHRTKPLPGDFEQMVRALVYKALADGKILDAPLERCHIPGDQIREIGQVRRKVSKTLRIAHGLQAREHIGRCIGSDCRDQRHAVPPFRLSCRISLPLPSTGDQPG
jgi:hypothetical protein